MLTTLMRLMFFCLPGLLLLGCSYGASAYIQIKVDPGKEFEIFDQVTLLLEDTQFELWEKAKKTAKVKRIGYIYDPDPKDNRYFFIDSATEINKGMIGIRFSEVMAQDISGSGMKIFHSLVERIQKQFGTAKVTYGVDEEGYNRLRDLLFNY